MAASGRHELPDIERDLAKLAYLLGYTRPADLVAETGHTFTENRTRFERLFEAAVGTNGG
jgi:hypothetical protein